MAVFSQPTLWDHTLGNNADVSVLPDDTLGTTGLASLQKLFQLINQTPLAAGGIAPSREDFNALFKLLGDSIFYMQNGGVWSYTALFDYPVGAVVGHNGKIYKCVQANGASSTVVTPGSDTAYWQRFVLETDIANLRMPIGMTVEWNSLDLPDNGLWENGAEYDEGDYSDLFSVIGYRFGSTTAVKANCSLGEAFVAGAAGNNIRITVAASGASFLVSTYVSGNQVDQQLVTAITELLNTDYVIWDTSATLTDGTDVTMSGGADGTSFKVPNHSGRYSRTADSRYPLGAQIDEQLPNITGAFDFYADNARIRSYSGAFSAQANAGRMTENIQAPTTSLGYVFDASQSNSIYTASGKVIPLSISKQSYIIYK